MNLVAPRAKSCSVVARILVALIVLAFLPESPFDASTRLRSRHADRASSPAVQNARPIDTASQNGDEKKSSPQQTPIEAEAATSAPVEEAPAPSIARGSANAFFNETEPNNTVATANVLPDGVTKVTGNIQPTVESDYFAFTAQAGNRVYAATQTAFGSVSDTLGLTTDSILTLLASDGTTVLETDDQDGSFGTAASSIAGAMIPTTGTYYLQMRGGGGAEIAPYELYVRVVNGFPTPEVEPNGSANPPNPIAPSGFMSGAVSTFSDVDTYSVSLLGGDTVYVGMDHNPERDATTFNGRFSFGPFDGYMFPVNDGNTTSPNSEAGFFTVRDPGTYFIVVDAVFGTGTYNLSVVVFPLNPTRSCTPFFAAPGSAIGPGAGLTQSTIVIPAAPALRVGNLVVSLSITHAWVADLDVSLVGPDGDEVMLFDDMPFAAVGSTPQIDVILDDEAGIPISEFNVYKGMRATTEGWGQLRWFRGELAAGTWTLNVRDDTAANGGTLNAWSLIICEDPPPPACTGTTTTVYFDDFETTGGGFTHSGVADEWELGTPTGAPISTANSGVRAWETDLDNSYEISSSQNLFSPPMSLAPYGGQTITVEWAMKHQIEASFWDDAFVEVREIGGAMAIKRLWEWAGPTEQRAAGVGNPGVIIQSASGWAPYRADISEFAGLSVQLVFHLDSDSSRSFDGLGIDDVRVTACVTAVPDVAISKSGPASVPCDALFTYTLTASNVGTAAATNVAVTDDLPDCLTGVMVSATSGTFSVGAGNLVTGTIPTLSPGSPVTIAITAIAPSGCGASISNQASIAASGDTTPGNNTSALVTTTIAPVSSCSLSPATDTNPILTAHTVTVTVTSCGVPQSGAAVNFAVTGRNNLTSSGNTNASGQISFTYTDTGSNFMGGTDTITTTVVSSGSTCTATKTWVAATCVPICPANITQPNDPNQCGRVVTYAAPTSTGNCGAITCSPASGSFFPVGTTTVTCSSQAGPSCTFSVTIQDTQAPVATCPAPITVPATMGTCSAVVTYTATATDNCSGATIVCTPASGSTFPVGTTTVTCTASDASPNSPDATCSFTVTVQDTQLPAITCPANIVVTSNTTNGCTFTQVVNYPAPTATDNCGLASVVCMPPSGSTFNEGTTTVTCTATDTSGNTAACSFTVTVGAAFGFCSVDDATGNRFQMVVNPASPSYGVWRFTVVATNTTYCGKANYVNYIPGVKLRAYDNDYSTENPTYFMDANFKGNTGTVTVRNVSGTVRLTLRDRNLLDSVCP